MRLAGPDERAAFERSARWQGFIARYGAWTALWNALTGTPHRAFGPPIRIAERLDTPEAVETAVRTFIANQPDLFGTPTLERMRVIRVRDLWYLSFRQVEGGLPLLGADWEFRASPGGELIAFGADPFVAPPKAAAGPQLSGAAARAAARAGLVFDDAHDRVEGGVSRALLPIAGQDGLGFQTVLEARVMTTDPPGAWRTLVDAASGEVLWRQDQIRHAIDGRVSGGIHPRLPTDTPILRPFGNLTVDVGTRSVVTDSAGAFDATAPLAGTLMVSAQLLGPYCDVNRGDGVPDATTSTLASDPATVDLDWASADDAERDVFYHVNRVHDVVKALDPAFTGLDYPVPCTVDLDGHCDATWRGIGLSFAGAGGGCPNTATLPDVVYHEYGHGVNDKLYVQAGASVGMSNSALHEGMADVLAAFVQDDPNIGKGLFGPGTVVRTLDNTRRWPSDASADPHVAGLIVAGAFWSLRQAVGLPVASTLAHFAKYGLPDDADDGVAMNEVFIEALVSDDDDANLANGTPHFAEIVAAFNAHGIGTGVFLGLEHTPLSDQTGVEPHPVTALVRDFLPPSIASGGLAAPPELHYAAGDGGFQTVTMTPTGNPDEYTAIIPAQAGVVRYYLSARNRLGETVTSPSGAPATVHRFVAGATTGLSLASSNPTSGSMRLSYVLTRAGDASLRIYDLRGRAVRTLVIGPQAAGAHVSEWDGRDDGHALLPAGVYFARLVTGGASHTRTLLLVP